MTTDLFTLDEANHLVPLMEHRFASVARRRAEIARFEGEMTTLRHRAGTNGGQSLELEIGEKQHAINDARRRLNFVLESIGKRGIIVRDPVQGRLDFPSLRDGRQVYLCWTVGEQRVLFWHAGEACPGDHQPI